MNRTAAVLLLAALQGCATPLPPAQAQARDCPALPTRPANPSAAQRDQHTEAIVALYLRCAGVSQ